MGRKRRWGLTVPVENVKAVDGHGCGRSGRSRRASTLSDLVLGAMERVLCVRRECDDCVL